MIKSGVIAMQNLSGIVRTKREPREIKILTPPPSLFFWYIYFSLSISSTYFFHHSALKLFFDREVQRTLCQRARFWSRPSSSNVAIPWGMVASRKKKGLALLPAISSSQRISPLHQCQERERAFPISGKKGDAISVSAQHAKLLRSKLVGLHSQHSRQL